MSRSRLFLLPMLLLVGCAGMELPRLAQPDGDELAARVDGWVAEREYGRALEALSRIDPKAPDYPLLAERRREVEDLARTYAEEVVQRAREAVAEGEWARALDLYDDALGRIPESAVLQDGLADLHRRQAARAEAERIELLIRRGRWLLEGLPILERIARVLPRDAAVAKRLAEQREAMRRLALTLAGRGMAAFEAGRYGVAEHCIPLAARLSDAPPVREAQGKLRAWREREVQERAAAAERAKAERARLWAAYRAALEAEDYREAAGQLDRIAEMAPEGEALARERRRLEAKMHAEAARLFEEGVGLYSRREFARAIDRWQRVLELEPGHRQAREGMERARRVMRRVERLREESGGNEGEPGD